MNYRLLIVDNDDQTEGIDEIQSLCKSKSFTIECHQFNVGLPDGRDVLDDEGKIDMKKVRLKFEKMYGRYRFHMIIFDFKLNDDFVDGLTIIKALQGFNITKKAKKMLYSSELDNIVQGYLDRYKDNDSSFDATWSKFKMLIKLDIIDFCKREVYENKVVEYIPKVIEDENDYIVDELRSHPDLKFNNSISTYRGHNLKEIGDLINKKDSSSDNFKRELIQMAIAEMAERNGK